MLDIQGVPPVDINSRLITIICLSTASERASNIHLWAGVLWARVSFSLVLKDSNMLQGQHEPGKSCPLCRAPIARIFRYGRTLNKRAIDRVQRSFMQHTGQWLAQANVRLANAEAAMKALLRDGEWGWVECHSLLHAAQYYPSARASNADADTPK